jgi:hypothetical protein
VRFNLSFRVLQLNIFLLIPQICGQNIQKARTRGNRQGRHHRYTVTARERERETERDVCVCVCVSALRHSDRYERVW